MDQESVEKTDPNILTNSDCEGAGEVFKVSPLIFSTDDEGRQLPVGLTVSSQLPLEALITGLKRVYTAQKSFRAEKSDTIKHLAEFYHIEAELAGITLNELLEFTERMVKHIISFVFDRCAADLDFLTSKLAPEDIKPPKKLLQECLTRPFVRIKHCDAIKLIHELVHNGAKLPDDQGQLKKVKLDVLPQPGEDLGSEHEKLLVRYFGWMAVPESEREAKLAAGDEFGAFVFLTHWPLKIKSFYMKQCDDGSGESESFDLLAPRVGEMFGGSMREWRHDKLTEEIARRGMDVSPIQWFVELRKSGSMPHGGWGMGFARLCMLVTGAPSVRDVVCFPVFYGHCPY
jgi:asparaginyl-tRNA synthetase